MSEKKRVILSFILGLVLGGALVYTGAHFCRYHWRSHAMHGFYRGFDSKRMLDKLTDKLGLDAGQKERIEKILDSNVPKMKEMKETILPQLDNLRRSLQSEIRAALRPDQAEKYDRLIREFEERRAKWKRKEK